MGQKIYRCRKKNSRGESHINSTGSAQINKFQSESMEIDKYSKLGPKIDEGQRKTVNGNLGQKIYRCREKNSRGRKSHKFYWKRKNQRISKRIHGNR